MTSKNNELKSVFEELKHLSIKRQQLLERKKVQCIFQELNNRADFKQREASASKQEEIESIDGQLSRLTARAAELKDRIENLAVPREKNKAEGETDFTEGKPDQPLNGFSSLVEASLPSTLTAPEFPAALPVFYIEPPPPFPAPTVILDLDKLPEHPCPTQCPECRQFVVTETSTSISSVTCLVCVMTALIGCIAGCCLIPFCCDRFKDITHTCPKCRKCIKTIKRL